MKSRASLDEVVSIYANYTRGDVSEEALSIAPPRLSVLATVHVSGILLAAVRHFLRHTRKKREKPMPDTIDYIRSDTAVWDVIQTNQKTGQVTLKRNELLWGDRVRVLGKGRDSAELKIAARGRTGYVRKDDLGGQPLLEVYFIDVGQGDGVLICTPDRRHVLIDGGWPRRGQPTGKNAADFVDWKFARDYELDSIELDAVMCSHNDQDHYGGLWDLFNPNEVEQLDIKTGNIRVERFYHAGLSWWSLDGKKTLGRTVETSAGEMFIDLIGSRASVIKALSSSANPKLHGEWAQFLRTVTKLKTRSGSSTPMQRLSHADSYVPQFGPESSVRLKVLAPVGFDADGTPGIRYYPGGTSKNTNGNSLLLRLEYGRSRILLTGDLNTRSMRALLEDWTGRRQELECDVAKACHHGSDDVSYEFLAAMRPAVTIISSGDSEGHDHPRPGIVAASATTGYLKIEDDAIVSPLVYSTELARSMKLGAPTSLSVPGPNGPLLLTGDQLSQCVATLAVTMAGDRNPRSQPRRMKGACVVAGTVYGLVNVRTDGERILCATMNEAEHTWQVKSIQSRF
jgi:beta-lactamase superfamily II metal-dependent hydrolase